MEEYFIHLVAIITIIIFLGNALFQILLSLGYPLGEAAMGGYFKILPKPLRFASAFSAVLLLFMSFVILQHTKLVTVTINVNSTLFIWGFSIFLALNTLANLMSKSKMERLIMTPISSIAFVFCVLIAMFS